MGVWVGLGLVGFGVGFFGLRGFCEPAGEPFPPFSVGTAREYLDQVMTRIQGQSARDPEVLLVLARFESQLGHQDIA